MPDRGPLTTRSTRSTLSEQQQFAFGQLPGMRLVATGIANGKPDDILVRVTGKLFILHGNGLLTAWKTAA